MKISSPMPTGSGAIIVHNHLEKHFDDYQINSFSPIYEFFPFLMRAFSDKNANIIHTTPDYGIFHTRKNQKLVVTLHNYVLDKEMEPYSSLAQRIHYKTDLRLFTKLSLEKAHIVTAVSQFVADKAKEDMGFKGEINVIPNGIDENFFKPVIKKHNSKEFKVLFSGNMTRRKGAHWLPKIIDKLPKNIKVFCATGLRTKIPLNMRHSEIQYLERVAYKDMPALYQSMDALLMPTTREGLSLAVLESMACGLPVVASKCSSLPEQIINGKGGYLCATGDANAYANALISLDKNRQLAYKMGCYNRKCIEKKYRLQNMLDAYQYVFEETLDLQYC
jgi:glycosyltransferase involved in cell wall biosynthesis